MHWQTAPRGSAAPAVAGVILLLAFAASLPAAPPDDQWHLDTSLDLWATAVSGATGIGPLQSDVDVSFDDLLKHMDFALMGGAELSKGNWLVVFNGMYVTLSDEKSGPLGGGIDIDSDMGIANLALGYTLVRTEVGRGMPLTITPVVGVQYTDLSLKLNPERLRSVERSRDWVDPYVGGRVVLGLSDAVSWRNEGTIGGFGLESDLLWSAGTFLDWRFSKRMTLNLGYRALSWDYDKDHFEWDVTLHGPWIGLTIRLF
jgi:opacity protein-like surface antigen